MANPRYVPLPRPEDEGRTPAEAAFLRRTRGPDGGTTSRPSRALLDFDERNQRFFLVQE